MITRKLLFIFAEQNITTAATMQDALTAHPTDIPSICSIWMGMLEGKPVRQACTGRSQPWNP